MKRLRNASQIPAHSVYPSGVSSTISLNCFFLLLSLVCFNFDSISFQEQSFYCIFSMFRWISVFHQVFSPYSFAIPFHIFLLFISFKFFKGFSLLKFQIKIPDAIKRKQEELFKCFLNPCQKFPWA